MEHQEMNIEEVRRIEAPAERVWERLRGFDGIEHFLPLIQHSEVEGQGVGAIRVCTTQDGGRLEERLEELDDGEMRLVYTIMASPMPLEGYRSTMQVRADGPTRSVVSWSASFRAAPEVAEDLRASMSGAYATGLDGLQGLFEAR